MWSPPRCPSQVSPAHWPGGLDLRRWLWEFSEPKCLAECSHGLSHSAETECLGLARTVPCGKEAPDASPPSGISGERR